MTAILPTACRDSLPTEEGSLEAVMEPGPRFDQVAEALGIRFHHVNGADGDYKLPEIMGSGAALFDYDLDGDLDAYFVQSGDLNGKEMLLDQEPNRNRMFRNMLVETGALSFRDVTQESGLGETGYGMGVAIADIDGDRDFDVYVTNVGSNALFLNNGDRTFSKLASAGGADDVRWNVSSSFCDYDGDEDLDLFVTGYVDFTSEGRECFHPSGAREYCSPSVYRPIGDRLFENVDGTFRDVTRKAGLGAGFGAGLGVVCRDFNDDGWMDIFVANDGTPNQLWMNTGKKSFSDQGLLSGAAYNAMGEAEAGMGIAAADFDQDGDEDLFLTHLTQETNTLYENNGAGLFDDKTVEYGLALMSIPTTGFGTSWIDVDLDADLDLFVGHGTVTRVDALLGEPFPYRQPDQLVLSTKTGLQVMGPECGIGVEIESTRGAAFGDVDNDGAIDILLNNNNGPAHLLLNRTVSRRGWIEIELAGKINRHGVGARILLTLVDGSKQSRTIQGDGSYASSSSLRAHFGLNGKEVDRIDVHWTSGQVETWHQLGADSIHTLREGEGDGGGSSPSSLQ